MQSRKDIVHSSMAGSRVLDLAQAYHLPAYLRRIVALLPSPSNQHPPVHLAMTIVLTAAKIREELAHPFLLTCRQAYSELLVLLKHSTHMRRFSLPVTRSHGLQHAIKR